jgi:hypothetical protein
MGEFERELAKYISEDTDRDGNNWWVINNLTGFIIDAFVVPSLYDIDKIKERIGAQEAPWVDSNYGFKTRTDCIRGLAKLLKLAEKKGKPCYKNGHTLSMNYEIGGLGSCAVCHTILNYICEKNSPSIMCEYDEEKDPSCDHCLHCGEPAERK